MNHKHIDPHVLILATVVYFAIAWSPIFVAFKRKKRNKWIIATLAFFIDPFFQGLTGILLFFAFRRDKTYEETEINEDDNNFPDFTQN